MLLDFRIKNFRGLRDEQILSLVASSDKELQEENTTPTGIKAAPYSLNSATIYGPNAGGKTTLILALLSMKEIILQSASFTPQRKLYADPFLLDDSYKNEPTSFEINFIRDGVRYEYGFSCTSEKVISEYLDVYVLAQPQRWFKRTLVGNEYHYTFSNHFKGQKKSWQNQTRPNALFLSTAVQLNSEQLYPVFDFFQNKLIIIARLPYNHELHPLMEVLYESESRRQEVSAFLRSADISIDAIDIIKLENPEGNGNDPGKNNYYYDILFRHKTDKGQATFSLLDESLGTRNLFSLIPFMQVSLENGHTMVVDELDSSLHPLVVRKLVQIFNSKDTNPFGAQLIFTTHDTSLLQGVGNTLLRRDQIWFVEKDDDQATTLYSLAEFSTRKGEAFERGYFQGRYGGLPNVYFNE